MELLDDLARRDVIHLENKIQLGTPQLVFLWWSKNQLTTENHSTNNFSVTIQIQW